MREAPERPREIAYYNPPAQRGKNLQLRGSEHATNLVVHAGGAVLGDSSSVRGLPDLSADWCSAQIRIVPERRQLWTSCQDNGFLVLQVSLLFVAMDPATACLSKHNASG